MEEEFAYAFIYGESTTIVFWSVGKQWIGIGLASQHLPMGEKKNTLDPSNVILFIYVSNEKTEPWDVLSIFCAHSGSLAEWERNFTPLMYVPHVLSASPCGFSSRHQTPSMDVQPFSRSFQHAQDSPLQLKWRSCNETPDRSEHTEEGVLQICFLLACVRDTLKPRQTSHCLRMSRLQPLKPSCGLRPKWGCYI